MKISAALGPAIDSNLYVLSAESGEPDDDLIFSIGLPFARPDGRSEFRLFVLKSRASN